MRVLHFYKTYLPDSFAGVERVIWQIAEGVAPLGVESHVLTLSATPGPKTEVVGHHFAHKAKLDFFFASTGFSISGVKTFADLAADADIVHYHFPWPFMDMVQWASGVNKPSIVTYHSDIVRQKILLNFYRPLMHRFLDRVDRIVATSPNYLETSPVLDRYRAKTSVIPIGLDPPPAKVPGATVARWRARLGQGFFLFVGALRYYKGLQFLLDAARISGLPVVLVGEGEMAADVAAAALPNVVSLGSVSDADKQALLDLAGVFVFPSHLRSEAFGVALLEGARAGKALISCDIGTGTSYVNIAGETGLVVPPADPVALAAAMQQMHANPEMVLAMGRAAATRFDALFQAKAMAQLYFKEYSALLA